MTAWQLAFLSEVLIDAKPGFACGDDPSDGVFQFRMNNITTEGQLDLSKKRRIPRDTRNLDSFLVKPGDVLFNATNSPDLVGKSAFFSGLDEIAVFSNHFLRLRPQADRLDGRFLARWLLLLFQRGVFQGMCRQWVNQATVNRDSLLKLQIPLPPLPEQQRIGDILDQADALRAKRRAALAKLDTLAPSIFLDMFGDPVRNPKGWPRIKLGEHTTKIGSGATPTGGEATYKKSGIALIRSMNVRDGFFLYTDLAFVDEVQAAKLEGVVVEAGDILLNITGASVARVCRVPDDVLPARVNQHVAIIRPTSILDTLFLEQLLLYPSMKRELLKISRAGATREAITKAQIEQLSVVCPPRLKQQSFASRVDAIEKLKTAHRASLAELDALFASLQNRAFRGEL